MDRLKVPAARLWSYALRPLHARRFRTATVGQDSLCIAIGTGATQLAGWLCTDVSFRASNYLNATVPWPVAPGSVARVYGDNVIEHFTFDQARRVLENAFAALAPSGRIRLATPDVERIAQIYLHDPQQTEVVLARHRRHGYSVENPVDLLRVAFCESGHHLGYLYDFASLSDLLTAAGFVDVVRREPGQSEDDIFRGLEQRVETADMGTTLVVEATRVC